MKTWLQGTCPQKIPFYISLEIIWILSVGFCNTPKTRILDASRPKGFSKMYCTKKWNIKKQLLRKIKLPQLKISNFLQKIKKQCIYYKKSNCNNFIDLQITPFYQFSVTKVFQSSGNHKCLKYSILPRNTPFYPVPVKKNQIAPSLGSHECLFSRLSLNSFYISLP